MSAAHPIAATADSPGTDGERRIGLFTIFRCTNYGAVLQAIALKRVLSRLFPDAAVEVINHWMDARDTHLLGNRFELLDSHVLDVDGRLLKICDLYRHPNGCL